VAEVPVADRKLWKILVPAAVILVDDKLGPYEIRSRIVAGGMGEVYAHKTLFEKSVAQDASR
jgi:hypothetical protein